MWHRFECEINPLLDLNIVVETSLSNQLIFGLEESDEENLEEEPEESNNDTRTIFISLCLFTLSLLSNSTWEESIILCNKILFKFKDNKKHTLLKKKQTNFVLKKNKL